MADDVATHISLLRTSRLFHCLGGSVVYIWSNVIFFYPSRRWTMPLSHNISHGSFCPLEGNRWSYGVHPEKLTKWLLADRATIAFLGVDSPGLLTISTTTWSQVCCGGSVCLTRLWNNAKTPPVCGWTTQSLLRSCNSIVFWSIMSKHHTQFTDSFLVSKWSFRIETT